MNTFKPELLLMLAERTALDEKPWEFGKWKHCALARACDLWPVEWKLKAIIPDLPMPIFDEAIATDGAADFFGITKQEAVLLFNYQCNSRAWNGPHDTTRAEVARDIHLFVIWKCGQLGIPVPEYPPKTQQITRESMTAILREFRTTPRAEQPELDRILDDMAEQELKEQTLSRPDRFEVE